MGPDHEFEGGAHLNSSPHPIIPSRGLDLWYQFCPTGFEGYSLSQVVALKELWVTSFKELGQPPPLKTWDWEG